MTARRPNRTYGVGICGIMRNCHRFVCRNAATLQCESHLTSMFAPTSGTISSKKDGRKVDRIRVPATGVASPAQGELSGPGARASLPILRLDGMLTRSKSLHVIGNVTALTANGHGHPTLLSNPSAKVRLSLPYTVTAAPLPLLWRKLILSRSYISSESSISVFHAKQT